MHTHDLGFRYRRRLSPPFSRCQAIRVIYPDDQPPLRKWAPSERTTPHVDRFMATASLVGRLGGSPSVPTRRAARRRREWGQNDHDVRWRTGVDSVTPRGIVRRSPQRERPGHRHTVLRQEVDVADVVSRNHLVVARHAVPSIVSHNDRDRSSRLGLLANSLHTSERS